MIPVQPLESQAGAGELLTTDHASWIGMAAVGKPVPVVSDDSRMIPPHPRPWIVTLQEVPDHLDEFHVPKPLRTDSGQLNDWGLEHRLSMSPVADALLSS